MAAFSFCALLSGIWAGKLDRFPAGERLASFFVLWIGLWLSVLCFRAGPTFLGIAVVPLFAGAVFWRLLLALVFKVQGEN